MLFQTTNSLDIFNIPCFGINIKQTVVYGQFQHVLNRYWFALIIHPNGRHIVQFACLILRYNRQCVQPSLWKSVLLISKPDNHPFNEMVIEHLLYNPSLPLILAGQLSIAGQKLLTLIIVFKSVG